MPEVPSSLAQYLKQEFRWQVRKKDQMNIESKLKVCRFLGEMVKFGLFPKSEVLFCVKQLLFDFSHHHIDMACTLMEACGRFLYRSPDSHRRTKIYLVRICIFYLYVEYFVASLVKTVELVIFAQILQISIWHRIHFFLSHSKSMRVRESWTLGR